MSQQVVIVYVGDLDPSGADMDRDIVRRLGGLLDPIPLEFRRLALTIGQVQEHALPPNPTKLTDSRARDWAHGKDSWELDALPAPVLAGLVRNALDDLKPGDFMERQQEDQDDRDLLMEAFDG